MLCGEILDYLASTRSLACFTNEVSGELCSWVVLSQLGFAKAIPVKRVLAFCPPG